MEERVRSLACWYHKIELPLGVVTPGWAPLAPNAYRIPESLEGKRVLDIGAWDGYWTFEALKRGAQEVVAIDDFSDYLSVDTPTRKGWENFDLCRELLGYDENRCKRLEMNLYHINEERLGRFDVVFFFGVLYHLRYPLLALDCIAQICDGEIFIESAILDDFSPYQGGFGHGYDKNQMVMEFYPRNEYANNDTNWWVPTLVCLASMASSAGFADVKGWKLTANPEHLPHCRGFLHAKKDPSAPRQAYPLP
jgi:tRNA (mo5U34)-methyltransferase